MLAAINAGADAVYFGMPEFNARIGADNFTPEEMKEGIHPKYEVTTVKCACGNEFLVGSTKKDIRVEICSNCHPFFTGKQKLVDTGGRVDRFKKRFNLGK